MSRSDRIYSQENIKRRLDAERELSEVKKLYNSLLIERESLVKNNSRVLKKRIEQETLQNIFTEYYKNNAADTLKEIEQLLEKIKELAANYNQGFDKLVEDTEDLAKPLQSYLTQDDFSGLNVTIQYKTNFFNVEVSELVKKYF